MTDEPEDSELRVLLHGLKIDSAGYFKRGITVTVYSFPFLAPRLQSVAARSLRRSRSVVGLSSLIAPAIAACL
jgi:hypothetical protein